MKRKKEQFIKQYQECDQMFPLVPIDLKSVKTGSDLYKKEGNTGKSPKSGQISHA